MPRRFTSVSPVGPLPITATGKWATGAMLGRDLVGDTVPQQAYQVDLDLHGIAGLEP